MAQVDGSSEIVGGALGTGVEGIGRGGTKEKSEGDGAMNERY